MFVSQKHIKHMNNIIQRNYHQDADYLLSFLIINKYFPQNTTRFEKKNSFFFFEKRNR